VKEYILFGQKTGVLYQYETSSENILYLISQTTNTKGENVQ